MYLHSQVIEYSGDPTITLRPLGDIHLGTSHCDRKLWLRDVESVRNDPNAYWLGMGDYCECITKNDLKRFAPEEIDKEFRDNLSILPQVQRDRFIADVLPIKDKCIGLLSGNHEDSLVKFNSLDIIRDFCTALDTPYLGDTALIRLTFRHLGADGKYNKSHTVIIYAEHGHGGGRKTGGKINAIEDMMGSFDADIYLMGHVHTKAATKHPRLSLSAWGDAKLQAKTRVCGLTGTYYRTYEQNASSYGEKKSYPPTELGSIAIRIRPMTGEMETVS